MTTKLTGGAQVAREVDGLVVRMTAQGIYLREKGRRLEVGPFAYQALYSDWVQRSKGFNPIRPAKVKRAGVTRGLLGTQDGK